MEHRDVFLLETITDYCEKMSKYLAEQKISEELFLENPYHQDICAFYCLQIGENANDLSSKFTELHPEMEWRKIIGLRHLIAHEYGSIDAEILWKIVTENIPKLHKFCIEQIR